MRALRQCLPDIGLRNSKLRCDCGRLTDELYDVILFLTHSFVRPIVTELYAIKHSDITVADRPDCLILIVRDGKTSFRAANTMSGAVPVYKRIQKRNPDAKPEDFIFLPEYANRQT